MFDYLDPNAQICGEISSISKLEGRLEGHAFDPITAGLSMDAVVKKDYFARTAGHVLCFGAGGSTVATALHLIRKPDAGDRPKRMVVINRSLPRLEGLQKMVGTQKTDIQFEYIHNADPKVNDGIMAGMPEGTIVINATAWQDSPGSPITWDGLVSKAWHRLGIQLSRELDFAASGAGSGRTAAMFSVEDGWLYSCTDGLRWWPRCCTSADARVVGRLEAAAATVRQ
jgi:hypothetical protein